MREHLVDTIPSTPSVKQRRWMKISITTLCFCLCCCLTALGESVAGSAMDKLNEVLGAHVEAHNQEEAERQKREAIERTQEQPVQRADVQQCEVESGPKFSYGDEVESQRMKGGALGKFYWIGIVLEYNRCKSLYRVRVKSTKGPWITKYGSFANECTEFRSLRVPLDVNDFILEVPEICLVLRKK